MDIEPLDGFVTVRENGFSTFISYVILAFFTTCHRSLDYIAVIGSQRMSSNVEFIVVGYSLYMAEQCIPKKFILIHMVNLLFVSF